MDRVAALNQLVNEETQRWREGSATPHLQESALLQETKDLKASAQRIEERLDALKQLVADERSRHWQRSNWIDLLSAPTKEVIQLQETRCLLVSTQYVQDSLTALSAVQERLKERVGAIGQHQLGGQAVNKWREDSETRSSLKESEKRCVNASIQYVTDSLMALDTLRAPVQEDVCRSHIWECREVCTAQWADRNGSAENVRAKLAHARDSVETLQTLMSKQEEMD